MYEYKLSLVPYSIISICKYYLQLLRLLVMILVHQMERKKFLQRNQNRSICYLIYWYTYLVHSSRSNHCPILIHSCLNHFLLMIMMHLSHCRRTVDYNVQTFCLHRVIISLLLQRDSFFWLCNRWNRMIWRTRWWRFMWLPTHKNKSISHQ